jgi:hypothetical protein
MRRAINFTSSPPSIILASQYTAPFGSAATHTLDESRDNIIVLLTALVIQGNPLLGNFHYDRIGDNNGFTQCINNQFQQV